MDIRRHGRLGRLLRHEGAGIKVRGTIDGEPFESAFMALGDGRHKLPVKAATRGAIGKEAGDTVRVRLEERIG